MSEAAESSETSPKSPVPGDLLDFWAVTLLVGLLTGAGLSPALKGSGGGLDWWIDRIDLAAGVMGQFAAMTTWLLTVQLLLAGFRARAERSLVTALALLGLWPIVALMGAQRATLPPQLWLGAVGAAAAGCLLAGSANRRAQPGLALVLICCGCSLALELAFVTSAGWLDRAPEALPRLRTTFGLAAAGLALWMQARQSRRTHLILPAVAAASGLLFLSAARAGEPEATTWILLVGRTLRSMTPDAPWAIAAWTPSFQLCLAIVVVVWTILERLLSKEIQSPAPLLAAVSVLALAVPVTPLSVAMVTLLGVAAIPTGLPRPLPGAASSTRPVAE